MDNILEKMILLENKQNIIESIIYLSDRISREKAFLKSIDGLGFSNLEKIANHHIDVWQRASKRLEERFLSN